MTTRISGVCGKDEPASDQFHGLRSEEGGPHRAQWNILHIFTDQETAADMYVQVV